MSVPIFQFIPLLVSLRPGNYKFIFYIYKSVSVFVSKFICSLYFFRFHIYKWEVDALHVMFESESVSCSVVSDSLWSRGL